MGASTTTNMASGGSISRKQQIGAKRGAMPSISQELIANSPNTTKTHTSRLQIGAHRAKRRLPICDTEKIRCLHCDGLPYINYKYGDKSCHTEGKMTI